MFFHLRRLFIDYFSDSICICCHAFNLPRPSSVKVGSEPCNAGFGSSFVDMYNETINSWSRDPEGLGQARAGLAAASLPSGLVFFAGGATGVIHLSFHQHPCESFKSNIAQIAYCFSCILLM